MTRELPILDLSVYLDVALAEAVAPLANVLVEQPHMAERVWRLVDARIGRLIRAGSRVELAGASGAMYEAAGTATSGNRSEDAARWDRAGGVLLAAAQASDRTAIPTIVRSYAGKAEALLHLLSKRGRPVKSEELREILATTPSNLSHLLTDLARSQLVERVPVGREAQVTLTAQGKGWVAANPGAASASPVAVAEAVVSTAYQRARMAELARYDSPLAAMAGRR